MSILIKKGRVIDPANKIDAVMDVLVENGVIKLTAPDISPTSHNNAEIIDAKGMWVVPGLIDMHVHLRDPGQLHKETIATGTRAAAAGGFTTVCAMPNTEPTADDASVINYIITKAAKEGIVNVFPVGSITKGLNGKELSDFKAMKAAGICAVSDDGKTVEDAALYKAAMEQAAALGLPVLAHCEDVWLAGTTPAAEEIIIARDIILSRITGAKLHICHVSTARGVELIQKAQEEGHNVTAEVTPHHFTLTAEDMTEPNPNYKMSPALRDKNDKDAVRRALKNNVISVIATDHAPHHKDEKGMGFEKAPNGVIGLETAVPMALTELVFTGEITPSELIAKFTTEPARILCLDKGHLSPGAVADITIINPDKEHVIGENTFFGLSRNSPFFGRRVRGITEHTIVSGKIVYCERETSSA